MSFRTEIATKVCEVTDMAAEKGWHDTPVSPLESFALIHSEVSEAVEEVRKGNPPVYQILLKPSGDTQMIEPGHALWHEKAKPEGELIELADAVIRIMHYCGKMGYDLGGAIEMKVKYNATRPYRHGNKLA